MHDTKYKFMKIQNQLLKVVHSNHGTAPLFVHCNLWQCIMVGGKSMYCIIENFSSQTLWSLHEGGAMPGFVYVYGNVR